MNGKRETTVNTSNPPSLPEALALFRSSLFKGRIELCATLQSNDGEPLVKMRNRFGGTVEQVSDSEWKWHVKSDDAAALVATAYALSGLYDRRKLGPIPTPIAPRSPSAPHS